MGGMIGSGGEGGMGASIGGAGSNGSVAFTCNSGAAGSSGNCHTGQTFCHIQNTRSGPAVTTCESFADTSRIMDCADSPTCDCLCLNNLYFHCHTECSCSETNGQVIVTCNPT